MNKIVLIYAWLDKISKLAFMRGLREIKNFNFYKKVIDVIVCFIMIYQRIKSRSDLLSYKNFGHDQKWILWCDQMNLSLIT